MPLRYGKTGTSVALKDSTIKILDEIARKEITSRSAIISKIIEENIEKYIKKGDK
jgi:metal-responsive CopG/Arc/MetJ family transcriptional regulator